MNYQELINTKEQEILELKQYLKETDYVVIKKFEMGDEYSIQDNIQDKRCKYRQQINVLAQEVENLRQELDSQNMDNNIHVEEIEEG